MFEIQMLIPMTDNDGNDLSGETAEFNNVAVDMVGGYTVLPAVATGAWKNEAGTVFVDTTRVYTFAVASIADGNKVVELAREACKIFRQEAISIRYLGQFEIIS